MRAILDQFGAAVAPRRARRRHHRHRRARAARPVALAPSCISEIHGMARQVIRSGRLMRPPLNKDTRLCISLAGPAEQHRHPVSQLPLRRARPRLHLQGVHHHRHRRGDRRRPGARHPGLLGVDAVQAGRHSRSSTTVEASARAIHSVNTIVNDDGHLTASNTDYIAVQRLIDEHGLALVGSGADPRQRRHGQRGRSGVPGQRLSHRHRRRAQCRERGATWPTGSATTTRPTSGRTPRRRHRQRHADRDGRRLRRSS